MNKVLERAGFENKEPKHDSKRMIVEEGHVALKIQYEEVPSNLSTRGGRVAVRWTKIGRSGSALCISDGL